MTGNRGKLIGLVLLTVALVFQLTGAPLNWFKQASADESRYWYANRQLGTSIGNWQGRPLDFKTWVYHYIPKPSLSGMQYLDPDNPTRYVEIVMVHSKVRAYLHDTNLCSYAQGTEQKNLKQISIPGTPVTATFSRLTVISTKKAFYQLSWYQWGQVESRPDFWSWMPVALIWNLFNSEIPSWHYFSLIYADEDKSLSEEEALDGLLRFANTLQRDLSTPAATGS
jgi:hypothetical protein